MQKRIATYLTYASAFSHLFCCFLPGVLSIVTLLASSGTVVVTLDDFGLPESMHGDLIAFSAIILIVSGIMNFISWRVDCREDGYCTHEPCEPKKNRYLKLYLFSVVFFFINAGIHFGFHVDHNHGAEGHHGHETHVQESQDHDEHDHGEHDHHDH